jgi:hypothetical protein
MKYLYTLYWAPEGKPIATVSASDGWAARKQAPQPYRRFIGEVYSVRHDQMDADTLASLQRRGFGKVTK